MDMTKPISVKPSNRAGRCNDDDIEMETETEQNEEEPVTKTCWLFDPDSGPSTKPTDLKFGRAKGYLIESIHRCVTKHDLKECFQLLKLLPDDYSLDPYVLFRYLMIMIETNKTEAVSKNVIYHLELLTTRQDLCKPDLFVEFLGYFIRHNRLEDAKELYLQRSRYVSYKKHRHIECVHTNLKCYEFLLNYLEWIDKITNAEVKPPFDLSIQGWLVNATESLISTTSNHEYFVGCVVQVLIYYGYTKKAYLLVSKFQQNNPLNIGTQLLFHNLLEYLLSTEESAIEHTNECDIEECDDMCIRNREVDTKNMNNFSKEMEDEVFFPVLYPIKQDKKSILENLRKLDISREEVIKLNQTLLADHYDLFRDSMDMLESVSAIGNIQRWITLRDLINQILDSSDEDLINKIKDLWESRYRPFWKGVDFPTLAGSGITKKQRQTIVKTVNLLFDKLDKSQNEIDPSSS